MAKRPPTKKRSRRKNPDRDGPRRGAFEHIDRNADGPALVSKTVQQAITNMVQLSSTVIEEQIRAGQAAAARMRDGIANSRQLNTDVNLVIDNLVATTKDVGATWLDLLSIMARSINTQSSGPGTPGGPVGSGNSQPRTITQTGTSGGAATISNITAADAAAVPPEIFVTGKGVKKVVLDLRPHAPRFVPVVRELLAGRQKHGLSAVKFKLSAQKKLVLTVNVPRGQAAGTYTGVIVDSSTDHPGGTVSVTIGS
ncbi:MAG TPA: hypothetical protein VGM00_08035 [Bradyrhizobium sp.]|jgi:hypothetical protein